MLGYAIFRTMGTFPLSAFNAGIPSLPSTCASGCRGGRFAGFKSLTMLAVGLAAIPLAVPRPGALRARFRGGFASVDPEPTRQGLAPVGKTGQE